jgi:hypothetical protein
MERGNSVGKPNIPYSSARGACPGGVSGKRHFFVEGKGLWRGCEEEEGSAPFLYCCAICRTRRRSLPFLRGLPFEGRCKVHENRRGKGAYRLSPDELIPGLLREDANITGSPFALKRVLKLDFLMDRDLVDELVLLMRPL